ncbi:MAG: C69 family dipeptidase, partial [Synergistaceae bacterium]|nr:C69 family dipeptidase [Synergistaceae bacterium]
MTILFFITLAAFLFFIPKKSFACMTILVGKKASATGEVLVGHNEDAPGEFLMKTHLVKPKKRAPGTKIKFEPCCSELELSENVPALYWSEAKTKTENPFDMSFCDFFVNGNGVSICSNNCADSKEDKPDLLNGGIGYGLRVLVAEKAKNARDAVEVACDLVEKYGYASSGRSYAFADKNEIFVMQIVNGKHYAISRVSDDEVAVIPNHYTIHEPDKNFRGYDELISYAEKRGWIEKSEESNFDFAKVYQSKETYGIEKNTFRHVKAFEILLEKDLSDLL